MKNLPRSRNGGGLIIFLILFSAFPEWGRLAEAAVSKQNTVPTAAEAYSVSSVNWSHTVNAGSNLMLVVGVSIDASDGVLPTTVTYNSVAMTNVANIPGVIFDGASAWQLVNPSTGSNTVEVTFSGTTNCSANSISFEGVNQTTPVANVTKILYDIGNNPSIDVTTVSGDYAFSVVSIDGNSHTPLSVTPANLEWEADNYDATANHTGGGATRAATSTTTNITWSWTGTDNYSTISFAIKQAEPGEQEGFRFRNDNGSETTASWLAGQDNAVTQPTSTNTRLRTSLATSADPASTQYQLEYKLSSDTAYKKVEAASGSLAFEAENGGAGATFFYATYPTGVTAGDLLVLAIANKYPTDAPSTPTGWTVPSNCQGSGGSGSSGADTGSVYSTVYVREADGSESGYQPITITSGNCAEASILIYNKGTGKTWSYACTNGSDNTAGTSWSVTGAADPGITAGDLVVVASAVNTDAYTYSSQAISATGVTFGAATERHDAGTTSGQDCWLNVSDHVVSSGTSSAAPVFTMTASGTAANRPAGASSILRLRQVNQPIQLSASANITASGDNTTTQLLPPSGKTTGDFVTGRMQDDENPADAIDITNNDYTELEWCLTATSSASNGQIYQFRVTAAGSGLETYTLTPQWTIGTPSVFDQKKASSFLTF